MRRIAVQLALLFASCLALALAPVSAQAAPAFQVLAFYNGTYDAAHISFVKEANQWFPKTASQNNFGYTATNDWNRLNSLQPSQYQVVLFLDDLPQTPAQRSGFERYMNAGGAFFGFHVAAFNTNPSTWDWYHNRLLGTGAFKSNTWGPTTATLKVENRPHPSTTRLPATFTSSVSEWYAWNRDLRKNPDIRILASVDPVSFPLGTDPNQSWYSGYYPILWTNAKYKMLYANFGHDKMNYETNQPLSSTFGSEVQNRFVVDGLLWLGGVKTS